MSFKYPSANNSTNERRARRGNWKSDVRKNKNIVAELTIIAKGIYEAGYVTANTKGFTVKMLTAYEITRGADEFECRCSDKRDLGTCAHIIATELFAAAREAEKQAKIAVSRKIIAGFEAAQKEAADAGKCFWCHDEHVTDDEGASVPCRRSNDRQTDEDFHFQAGEIELYYDNSGVWEAA